MSVFDGVEKAWNQGKKKLGEAVEWTTDHTAEVLDKAGAHKAARAVEHWGDETASDLGAAVGEQQLGHTDDPKQLVHGDAKAIDAAAKHLRTLHASFDSVHAGLQKVRATDWKGEGADAFTAKFVEHPKGWAQAADACEAAAGVLETYAHTVTWAQDQAKEAVRLYKKGKEANKKAVDDYNAKADAYNAKLKANQDPGPRPDRPGEPGNADMKEAERLLSEARKQRNTAAGEAKTKLDAALATAPRKPSFEQRMKADALDLRDGGAMELLHVGGGVVRSGTDAVKFARGLNPYDVYNVTHPAEYLNTVSNTAAGLLQLASHPERLPATLLGDGWGKDFSEASGRLGGNILLAVATGGGSAGAEAGEQAGIAAARKGAQEAAESGARQAARDAGRESAESGAARENLTKEPNGPNRGQEEKVCEEDPVDVATGRMLLPQADVTLPGRLPLSFVRHFESSYRAGVWFGPTWASTADQRLEIDAEGVVFVREDGVLLSYPHPAPGVPTLPTKGARWPLTVDAEGNYSIADPASGRMWLFRPYDAELALLDELTDRNGHRITYVYADDGTPTDIVHEAGYHLRITTHAGRITALHLAGAAGDGSDVELVRYGYTDGHLTEIVNSSGKPLRFGYDERGRITSWTDRNDSHFDYVYDDRDRCIAQGGTEGHVQSRFRYDEVDPDSGLRVTTITTALGNTSRFLINEASQVVAEIDPTGAVTRTRRDRHGRLLAHTDPLGGTTDLRYDDKGRLTAVARPDGREAQAAYGDALHMPTTVTDPDGSVWHQTYDAAGNRTSLTDPTGAVTRYTYDELGHPASITDALGNTTRVRCNAAGLVLEVTDPLGSVTSYRRDAFGRVTAVIDPMGSTTRLLWSVEGHLLCRIAPDGAEESWTYDGEGNCTQYVDALGGTTTYEYTHFDLLTAQTGPDGVRHEFTHDPELRLTEVTNPQGLTWTYRYDAAGRLAEETDFDGRRLTYTHDAAGRLTARTNGLGQTITYEHDALGRVVTKNADGVVTTYAYDAAGRLLETTSPDATLIYRRDRLGRVKSETTNGRTLAFTYDALGRRTHRITPGGAVSTWTYDATGRHTSLTASGHRFDIEHDAAGREVARHFGEGITLRHGWDAAGRVVSQSVEAGGTDRLRRRAYTYRRDGYLTAVNDRTFQLDSTGRVTAVDAPHWQERYAYDAAGNQTQASWPAAHPGAEAQGTRAYSGTLIKRAGTVRYEHDAQGRVVLRQKVRLSRRPDTWRYEWDAEDRLRTVTTPDGTRWRYLYDPLGRRIAKQRLTNTGEVAEQVDFTWDGPTLTEQTTVSRDFPNPVTLTWDHDGLRPAAQTERISAAEAPQEEIDSRFFAIVTDLVGTPTELIDETGATTWRSRTTLWGTTTWARDSTAYTPLRFPGQYFDPETELHYNFYRHYDPETGRYATPDPLGLAPAPNPASYVHNPHTWADPLGLSPCPADAANAPQRPQPPNTAFHYTTEDGLQGILDSQSLHHSTGPVHARFGDGQYFTDIAPDSIKGLKKADLSTEQLASGDLSRYQLVRQLFGRPSRWGVTRTSHFLEIDLTGLEIIDCRPNVLLHPNGGPLDLTGRIINHGRTPF
ncbi:putative T7SS-secreted protein [Streptomyces morookaense]|uniref:putative T7SS-secreted protein n=1 Tax=Streptomyces morookaense TaxID=1970 RepID=UPI00340A7C13